MTRRFLAPWWTRAVRIRERIRQAARRRRKGPTTAAEIGREGERIAAIRMAETGLRIVARNRRIAGVEIDILAADHARDEWVVVEVKTTSNGSPGERRVDRHRLRRLARAASVIGVDRAVRITIVAVDLRNTPPDIRMFET
ncbi:MAG: YraN family protein [Phycisphaerales bacterium]|nr:YraN family protein [Phycisphaerales bacterium]